MEQEVLNEARVQIGKYIDDIMKQRNINKVDLCKKAGITRWQLYYMRNGTKPYTIDTFLKVTKALDCYFFLADREGEHLNPEHMVKKSDPSNAMNFKKKK